MSGYLEAGNWEGTPGKAYHCLSCPPPKNVTIIETFPDFLPNSVSL